MKRKLRVRCDGRLHVPEDSLLRWGLAPGVEFKVEEAPTGLLLRPSDPPLAKVYVEPTSACNLRCGTCVRNSWNEPLGTMPLETYHRLVEGLQGVPTLRAMAFWGLGEPLLHPGIVEMVGLAHALGAQTELVSNGMLLDAAKAGGLVEAGLDRLVVSVDGATPESHAGARPGADLRSLQESLAQLREIQRRLRRDNPEIGLEFVATRRNVKDLSGLRRLAYEMQASFVVVTNVLPYSPEYKDDILYGLSAGDLAMKRSPWCPEVMLPRMDAHRDTVPPLVGLLQKAGVLDPLRGRAAEASGYCRFVREGAAAVAWDGGVSPCIALMHSYTCYILGREKAIRRYTLGNVEDEPITSIWAREEYCRFRQRVIEFDFSPCADCGGCQYSETNEEDCFGNQFPVCGDCLWARGIIQCP